MASAASTFEKDPAVSDRKIGALNRLIFEGRPMNQPERVPAIVLSTAR